MHWSSLPHPLSLEPGPSCVQVFLGQAPEGQAGHVRTVIEICSAEVDSISVVEQSKHLKTKPRPWTKHICSCCCPPLESVQTPQAVLPPSAQECKPGKQKEEAKELRTFVILILVPSQDKKTVSLSTSDLYVQEGGGEGLLPCPLLFSKLSKENCPKKSVPVGILIFFAFWSNLPFSPEKTANSGHNSFNQSSSPFSCFCPFLPCCLSFLCLCQKDSLIQGVAVPLSWTQTSPRSKRGRHHTMGGRDLPKYITVRHLRQTLKPKCKTCGARVMQPGLAPHEWVACGCRTHLSSNATDDLKILRLLRRFFSLFATSWHR